MGHSSDRRPAPHDPAAMTLNNSRHFYTRRMWAIKMFSLFMSEKPKSHDGHFWAWWREQWSLTSSHQQRHTEPSWIVELEMKVLKDYTIRAKATSRSIFLLKVPTRSRFNNDVTMLNRHLSTVVDWDSNSNIISNPQSLILMIFVSASQLYVYWPHLGTVRHSAI